MQTVRQRLREPSTWAGLGAIITSAAQAYATRDPQAVAAVVVGLLAVVLPERSAPPKT